MASPAVTTPPGELMYMDICVGACSISSGKTLIDAGGWVGWAAHSPPQTRPRGTPWASPVCSAELLLAFSFCFYCRRSQQHLSTHLLLRVLRLQVQQLRHDGVAGGVINGAVQTHYALLEQPRVYVIGTLPTPRALNHLHKEVREEVRAGSNVIWRDLQEMSAFSSP